MSKIAVIPTKPSAEKLRHPVDGLLGKGKEWTYDSFTMRRLTDGSVVRGTPAPVVAPAALAGPVVVPEAVLEPTAAAPAAPAVAAAPASPATEPTPAAAAATEPTAAPASK